MPFAATWMDPEIANTKWSKSDREREMVHNIPSMWNPQRSDIDEPVYKAETDPET